MASHRGSGLSSALRLSALVALSAALLLSVPRAAPAEPPAGPAGWLYDPTKVVGIDLGLPQASIEALEAEPGEYQPGTFSLEGDGESFGPLDVGIRLKGGLGSFRDLGGKAAFKVKFDEYVDDQTFFGLEKLTLNNMVQDRSMIHEALAYELFRSLGIPASRTGYAFLAVNGEDFGVYLNVETLDAVSLPRWFASTRHLYEGSYLNDVRPGAAGEFEVDEGKSKVRDDLEALIAAANSDAGDWSEGMAAVADLEEMALNWAAERYLGHWDGYAGRLLGHQPNNYYLHSEDSGLFRMLPWGVDQTWEERIRFDEPGGIMFDRCLADESCAALYRDGLREVRAQIAALDLDSRALALEQLLRPWQEIDPRREQRMIDITAAVGRTRIFVAARGAELAKWLGEPLPESTGPAVEPRPESAALGARAGELGPAASPLRILRSRVAGGAIRTRILPPSAGVAEQRGTIELAGGRLTACFARKTTTGDAIDVRCRLNQFALRRLRQGPLVLRLLTCVTPRGGTPACVVEGLTVPRASGTRVAPP